MKRGVDIQGSLFSDVYYPNTRVSFWYYQDEVVKQKGGGELQMPGSLFGRMRSSSRKGGLQMPGSLFGWMRSSSRKGGGGGLQMPGSLFGRMRSSNRKGGLQMPGSLFGTIRMRSSSGKGTTDARVSFWQDDIVKQKGGTTDARVSFWYYKDEVAKQKWGGGGYR